MNTFIEMLKVDNETNRVNDYTIKKDSKSMQN